MTAAFDQFRCTFFTDDNSARDGLDLTALTELSGAERTLAETMLIASLPDTRSIIGLGVVGSKRASRLLEDVLISESCAWREARRAGRHEHSPTRMIEAARALWLIRPDRRWLMLVLEVLALSNVDSQRADAALKLDVFHDADAVAALVTALDDRDNLVRHHAARSLLALHALDHESKDPEHMLYRIMADDDSRRDSGIRAVLLAISGALTKG
jgi:hypothetical protein